MTATNATTNAIVDFLLFNGHVAWRNNTTGVFDPRTQRFRPAPVEARGTADIVCCLKGGLYLEVEVKTGNDKLSANQETHRERIDRVGGLYVIVRTFDEFRHRYEVEVVPAMKTFKGAHEPPF